MNEQCGRLMLGSGPDESDPVCELPEGHKGLCKSSAAVDQHRMPRQPGPLNDKSLAVLRALLEESPITPNDAASRLGFRPGMARHGNHGRGNVARTMGVAVHVNTALTALRKRGMTDFRPRPDGWSGTAYGLTALGEQAADTEVACRALERVREANKQLRQ